MDEMSNNKSDFNKSSCYLKNPTSQSLKYCKSNKCIPKKVISSKKIVSNAQENKSFSTSAVTTKKCQTKPKKVTQSEVSITQKAPKKVLDYCKKCGDELERSRSKDQVNKIIKSINVKSVRNDNNIKKSSKLVQQYYKNENFRLSTESVPLHPGNSRKEHLDPIKEVSELNIPSEDSIYLIHSDSDEDITKRDLDDTDIKKLKQFRNKNYFECHSTQSRLKNKPNVTSLINHKCVYRFYLNDRLFPVPLNTDYNNKIRCVECHLPMDIEKDSKNEKINGTLQAKVRFGKETQDMILLLPVKESLIIKERRTEERKVDDKYVYFGVVQLSDVGKRYKTLPQDSLALKYQRGYKEFKINDRYTYRNINDNDVIVI